MFEKRPALKLSHQSMREVGVYAETPVYRLRKLSQQANIDKYRVCRESEEYKTTIAKLEGAAAEGRYWVTVTFPYKNEDDRKVFSNLQDTLRDDGFEVQGHSSAHENGERFIAFEVSWCDK